MLTCTDFHLECRPNNDIYGDTDGRSIDKYHSTLYEALIENLKM